MAKIKTIHTLGNDYDIYDASAIHDVDSVLNETSINPVENQVVTSALNTKSEVGHDHNDAYYTKDEADTILAEAQKFAPTVNSTTANYQLSQWASTDRILMADFNSDNAKIDTALSALAEAVAAKADGAAVTALAEAVNGKADGADVTALQNALSTEQATRQSADTALEAAIDQCGNCHLEKMTYSGAGKSGSSNKVSVTFSRTPLVILICGNGNMVIGVQGASGSVGNQSGTPVMSWSGNKVSWYHNDNYEYHMNKSGVTYTVYALAL